MRRIVPDLKPVLNSIATRVLSRFGYSDPMIRDAKREGWWWLTARSQATRRRTGLLAGRGVVWTAPGRAELVRVEVATARDGEATVEIDTSVVSPGTERAQYLQLPNTTTKYPFQPGYSAAGVVVAAGANGASLEPGDRVAVRNVPHVSVATVPSERVHRVPDGVPLEAAAFVQIGVICSHGVRRAVIEPGEAVAVLGAGLIGTIAMRLALAEGCGPVTMIARTRAKESVALAGGATSLLATGEDDERIRSLAAPVVIEATGDPGALATAVAAAGSDGRIVLLGSSRGITIEVPVGAIRRKRLRVVGAHVRNLGAESRMTGVDQGARDAATFLGHLAAGRVHLGDLLDEVVDPREPGLFYRRLVGAQSLVAARYDWTLLAAEERMKPGRLLRPPPLSASGTDLDRRPVAARRSSSTSSSGTRSSAAQPVRAAPKTLRIGLLGCGEIAVKNAAAVGVAPGTRLVACFDPVRDVAVDIASAHGATVCSTSEALVERADVDAVLICSPHHLHAPLGIQAARAGKHVIVEKPLANDLAGAQELVDAADDAGVVLSVCFPYRYHPDLVEARRLVGEGALGPVSGVALQFLADKAPSYWAGGYSGRVHTSWRRSRSESGGGVLIMNLSHYVDIVRHVSGLEADFVVAQIHAEEPGSEVEDAVSVLVRYANGAIGSMLGAAAARGTESAGRTELRLWGRDGHLALAPRTLLYTLRAMHGTATGRWQAVEGPRSLETRAQYFDRLASAIAAGEPPDVSGRDGLAVQAFIEAAYRSSEDGTGLDPGALLEGRT